jgi:lysophospholipase
MTSAAPLFDDVAQAPKGGQAFWLTAQDGVNIRVAHWAPKSNAKGTILMFPGRTEYIEKYGRDVSDFLTRGFATVVIDWRGQGLGQRLLDDPMIGHVGEFADYQLDVQAVLAHLETQNLPKPYFLIGHSMGGCIGLRALHEGLPVAAAVFSAPMWGIQMSPVLRPVAWALSTISKPLGFSSIYSPGQSGENLVIKDPFEGNPLTTDTDFFHYMRRQLVNHPELGLGGPSLRWLNGALVEMATLAKMPAPSLPILALLGTDEAIVEPDAIRDLIAKAPNGRLIEYDGGQHEILMERPEIRDHAIDQLTTFFAEHTLAAA